MGTPTTFSDYRRSSASLEITELMVGKCANGMRVVPFQIIRSSGTRRLSPTGRWREWSPALCRFAPSPTINSVLSISGELRRTSCCVFEVQ
jgi:hypothetical protein